MKKTAIVMLILSVLLLFSSCKGEPQRFFDYQDSLKYVCGKYSENDREYSLEMYFTENEKGDVYCRRVEYTAPDSIKGLTFTLEGKNITAELCGVRIADSYFEKEEVFRMSALFALSEEDIYDIKAGKDGICQVFGKNGDAVWQVTTDKKGLPVEIAYENGEGKYSFSVEKIKLNTE